MGHAEHLHHAIAYFTNWHIEKILTCRALWNTEDDVFPNFGVMSSTFRRYMMCRYAICRFLLSGYRVVATFCLDFIQFIRQVQQGNGSGVYKGLLQLRDFWGCLSSLQSVDGHVTLFVHITTVGTCSLLLLFFSVRNITLQVFVCLHESFFTKHLQSTENFGWWTGFREDVNSTTGVGNYHRILTK